MTYAALGEFYGWTFEQCRRMRLRDFNAAVDYMNKRKGQG